MAYPNLVAEMARIGITEKDLAAVAEKSPELNDPPKMVHRSTEKQR